MRRLAPILLLAAFANLGGGSLSAAELSASARRLSQYLRIDTTNPPGHERAAVDLLAAEIRAAGIQPQILISPSGRASLYARLPANSALPRSDSGALLLLHHVDVVPAGDGWQHAPFGGEVHEGAIYGRGAIDAKGLGVAHLAAFLDQARSGLARHRDLVFLAVADEEAGGTEGSGWLLEAHPELFAGSVAVLNEGGVNRAVDGRALFWGVEIDQKRPLWLEVVARGRGGHASSANPESASHQLIRGLARLVAEPQPWRVVPAARGFLTALARFDPQARSALARLGALEGAPSSREAQRALASYESLLSDTLQVTTLSGSDRINVVAAEAWAGIDLRLLPDADADATLKRIRATLGPELDVRILLSSPAAPPSPTDTAIFRALAEALGGTTGAPVVPAFIPAFTDSRYFRARGIPAYGVSPFALDGAELRTVHAPEERIPLAVFDRGVETMIRVVRRILSEPDSLP